MRHLTTLFTCLLALTLAGCGGSGDTIGGNNGGGGGGGTGVASLTLVASSPQIPSDGSTAVDITAFARNATNQFVPSAAVTFSANSGGLAVTQGTTDTNGVATASLTTAGDPTNRTITVTAISGAANAALNVDVAGTQLVITGPSNLVQSATGTYTVTLANSSAQGIPNRTVTLAATNGNALSSASVVTDANGRGTVQMTGTNGGASTLTAQALGLTATVNVTVNNDSFAFTSPAANTEIALGALQTLTLTWTQAGTPQVGQTINFATTRGTFAGGGATVSAVTNASGVATVQVSATNAGPAVVTGSAAVGPTASLSIEFVATTPASIDVQASPFTIATLETSTITAVVRDAQNNLVKNSIVVFQLTDVTGGSLSTAAATTDSQGRAQTVYTASTTTSAANGVVVAGTVQGTAVTDSASITVARKEVFISMGTGNDIDEPTLASYRIQFVVFVTDASGNAVSGVPLTMRLLSTRYYKGRRVVPLGAPAWVTQYTIVGGCLDEDRQNHNGVLDPGEDFNNSGQLEAGNVATVTPSNVVTGTDGSVLVNVTYPQDHAQYVDVQLEASTLVQGTEFSRSSFFNLPIKASDMTNTSASPPGPFSPYGTGTSCADTL
jgi:hypothetical protein